MSDHDARRDEIGITEDAAHIHLHAGSDCGGWNPRAVPATPGPRACVEEHLHAQDRDGDPLL